MEKVRTTRGSKIRPINGLGMSYLSAVSSIEATTKRVVIYNTRGNGEVE